MTIDSQNSAKTAVEKEDDEIDLMALLLALLRGWKTILFFAILGLLIGILYSRYVNPTYKSEALIQIDEKSKYDEKYIILEVMNIHTLSDFLTEY